jgi:hypothetical protein
MLWIRLTSTLPCVGFCKVKRYPDASTTGANASECFPVYNPVTFTEEAVVRRTMVWLFCLTLEVTRRRLPSRSFTSQ